MKKEVKALAKWLESNSASELASMLGYRTTNTISAWIRNDRIPARQRAAVLAIIERKYTDESTKTGNEVDRN